MLEILNRLTTRHVVKFIHLPVSLWINFQWAGIKYRETSHLLRLDDYLLQDMGLRKLDGRIEAIDPSRINYQRSVFGTAKTDGCRSKRYRHAS